MAKQKKSGLMAKLGERLRKAHEAHKDDELELDNFAELPPFIDDGIARLTKCELVKMEKGDNKGEYCFVTAAVVVEPAEAMTYDKDNNPTGRTMKVRGLRTSLYPEPLCDTPKAKGKRKTLDDHVAHVYQVLRGLGCDMSQYDPDEDDFLEQACAAVTEAGPYFRFRTWRGDKTKEFPDPKTNHKWLGVSGLEDYEPAEEEEDVDDNSADDRKASRKPADEPDDDDEDGDEDGDEDDQEEEAAANPKASVKANANGAAKTAEKPAKEPKGGKGATLFDEFDDVDSLAKKANAGGEEAGNRLTAMALKAGMSKKEIKEASDWSEVAERVKAGRDEPDEDEEEGDEDDGGGDDGDDGDGDEPPQVEDHWRYKPDGAKKPVLCEVTAVQKTAQTVTLKTVKEPHKVYKAVPWSELVGEDATA